MLEIINHTHLLLLGVKVLQLQNHQQLSFTFILTAQQKSCITELECLKRKKCFEETVCDLVLGESCLTENPPFMIAVMVILTVLLLAGLTVCLVRSRRYSFNYVSI